MISTVKIFNGATYRRRIKKKKNHGVIFEAVYFSLENAVSGTKVLSVCLFMEKSV